MKRYKPLFENINDLPDWNNISKYLSKKAISLLDNMGVTFGNYRSGPSGQAGGTTAHGDDGPIVNYSEIETALHELGHAISYPFKKEGEEFKSNYKEIVALQKSVSGVINNSSSTDFKWVDTTNIREEWADTFKSYFMPLSNLWMQINYPSIYKKMFSFFGKAPLSYTGSLSDELTIIFIIMKYDYHWFPFPDMADNEALNLYKQLLNIGYLKYKSEIAKILHKTTQSARGFNQAIQKIEKLLTKSKDEHEGNL